MNKRAFMTWTAGGASATAHYEQVGMGNTEHAESVRVRYNPAQIW